MSQIKFTLNGAAVSAYVEPNWRLLDLLRDTLGSWAFSSCTARRTGDILLPVLRFLSVIGSAADWLPGDRAHSTPCLPSGSIQLSLLFLGKFFVRNKFFHFTS